MNRSPLRRSGPIRARPKPKRPVSLVAKALGRSAVHKGPVRSKDHLARVREQPCLVCGISGVQAHHLRIGLRTMGVRKDDRLSVPLCPRHHAELHSMKEEAFWALRGIDPLAWCARFANQSGDTP